MSNIQVNGQRYQTATVWQVDQLLFGISATSEGPVSTTAQVFDPLGPNAGMTSPDITINSWTNTLIDVEFDDVAFGDIWIAEVTAFDVTETNSFPFDVSPDQPNFPPCDYPLLEGIFSPAVDQVAFTGQRFLTATAGAITNGVVRLDSYSTACFDGGSLAFDLAAPVNDWVVISVSDTLIVLENPRFSSCTPDDLATDFTVQGVSFDAPNFGTPLCDGYYFYEPWGDPSPYSAVIDGTTPVPTEPTITLAYDIGEDELTVTFDQNIAATIDQLIINGTINAAPFAGITMTPGDWIVSAPNQLTIFEPTVEITLAAINPGDNIVLDETEAYSGGPLVTDDLVASEAFTAQAPLAPNIVTASSPASATVLFQGTNLDRIGRIDLTHSGGGVAWYNEVQWGPNLNDPALTIIQWTATDIEIMHNFVAGNTAQSADTVDRTNPPTGVANGSFNFPDFLINP